LIPLKFPTVPHANRRLASTALRAMLRLGSPATPWHLFPQAHPKLSPNLPQFRLRFASKAPFC